MAAYLCVRISGFYAAQHEPEVVVHRDKRVLDAGLGALERGVFPGMGLAEARATFGEGKYLLYEALSYRASRDAWLDRCAEVSNSVEPVEDHLAFLDLSLHPDPLDVAQSLSERLPYPASLGLSPTKWVARLAAERTPPGTIGEAPDPASFIAPFAVRDLAPVPPEHRERLDFLGYRTIAQAAQAPPTALGRQFGRDAALIQSAAKGRAHEPVLALYPPDSIAVEVRFPGGSSDLEATRRGAVVLAKRLSTQLIEQDRQGVLVRLIVEREEGEPSTLERRFARPIQSLGSTTAALQALLTSHRLEDCESPILSLRARMPNLTPTTGRQRSLLGLHVLRDVRSDALAAVESVRTSLPDGAILRASELKQTRRLQVLKAWRDATGWF